MSAAARRRLLWLASLASGALLLGLAAQRLTLLPPELLLHLRPAPLAAALALQLPYAALRSLRLRYPLDPLVCAATQGRQRRLHPGLLHGGGWVSFLLVLLLPLRLGELARPLLLARAPGVGVPEAAAAVVAERALDGLVIVALLLAGLALAEPRPDALLAIADLHRLARLAAVAFAAVLLALLAIALAPGRLAGRLALRPPVAALLHRLAAGLRPLAAPAQGLPFLAATLLYWTVTVIQLGLVLGAVGLDLGLAEASVLVATIGLAVQLPGGPAQAGSFQIGALAGLALFLGDADLAGPGSAFTALMYLVALLGALAMALPGALWLRRAEPASVPSP